MKNDFTAGLKSEKSLIILSCTLSLLTNDVDEYDNAYSLVRDGSSLVRGIKKICIRSWVVVLLCAVSHKLGRFGIVS